MEISLCMIVKNEEDALERCLQSVYDLMDEIIIVDTGSTDITKEIAARYTDKIYDFVWIGDFSAARNFSFSKATKEYCMWMDADDILTQESREAFSHLKDTLSPDVNVVVMPYHTSFTEDGRLLYSLLRERIVKRNAGFQWEDEIHETINHSGKLILSDVAVTHTKKHGGFSSDRNFYIAESAIQNGNTSLKMRYYYAAELSAHMRPDEAITQFEIFFAQGGKMTVYCLDACIWLHDLYLEKKQYDKALKLSLDCLEFCADRSEFCCQLGYYYANIMKDLNEAIYWFNLAVECPRMSIKNYNIREQYYYYIPYFQLGNAYCMQNLFKEGLKCFKKALEYYENSPEVHALITKLYHLMKEQISN